MDYTVCASRESVLKTVDALKKHNFDARVVDTKEEAFNQIKALIPAGASVNNGSSTTLSEIGLVDYLKTDQHGWNNLHEAALAKQDPSEQAALRNQTLFADYYLGSVHALSETGEMIIASASGSQLPPIAFTSPHLIFVIGTQKIVPTLEDGLKRVREHVFPLENARMQSVGMGGSVLSKILIFEQEPGFMNREVKVILVNEKLGF